MEFKVAICDDDSEQANALASELKQFYALKDAPCPSICVFNSSEEILSSDQIFDIAFLDIELPGEINGIRIGHNLRTRSPNIIIFFITSHENYLDDAMDYQAFRFLTKPVDRARLFRSMEKAMEKYRQFTDKITVKTPDETKILLTRDIVMIEVVLRKVYIYTTSETICSTMNFKSWVKELCARNEFFRPHRCYIVGLRHVSSYKRNEISLCNGKYAVPISRDLYNEFDKTMIFYYADVPK